MSTVLDDAVSKIQRLRDAHEEQVMQLARAVKSLTDAVNAQTDEMRKLKQRVFELESKPRSLISFGCDCDGPGA